MKRRWRVVLPRNGRGPGCGSGQGGRWRDISGRGYLPSGRPSERASGLLIDRRIGVHTAPSKSVTLAAAAEDWLNFVTLEKREPATIASYRQHVAKHIAPRLGASK